MKLVDKVKEALDIASPSKIFTEKEKNRYCVDCVFFRDREPNGKETDGVWRCYCAWSFCNNKPRLPFDDGCTEWMEGNNEN